MTDFETWVLDNSDRVYRYWIYKRMFTPYELDGKFVDESEFVTTACSFGMIREAIELPDGDILLGFIDPEDYNTGRDLYVAYHKLSEIKLAFSPSDQEAFVCEDD